MADEPTGLSGSWTGRYDYDLAAAPCAFTAWLSETAGSLSGESVEPNTFAPIASDTLLAVLSGLRDGSRVAFTKTYTDLETDQIAYDGTVDAGFRRIGGTWRLIGAPWVQGSFLMVRAPKATARRDRMAEATG